MSELGGIGEVVTGAMVGRAVEPKAGEIGPDGNTQETHCLNCGVDLTGPFCAQCGQHAHVHRTLGAFFHDFLHGVLHLDGKVWRTLPMLAWNPGELTRRYIDGQRARFLSPMALFLFAVFLMFAAFSVTAGDLHVAPAPQVKQEIKDNLAKDEARLKTLQDQRAKAVAAGQPVQGIDAKIASLNNDLKVGRAMVSDGVAKGAVANLDVDAPGPIREGLKKATDNPDLFLYKIKSSAYKWSWAMIPLSVPFIWLLFPFSRRFRLYDHTVFVTYSLAFVTLLASLVMILGAVGMPGVANLASLLIPVHFYRQLKATYDLSVGGALWRTLALTIISSSVLICFVLLLIGLGLFD